MSVQYLNNRSALKGNSPYGKRNSASTFLGARCVMGVYYTGGQGRM